MHQASVAMARAVCDPLSMTSQRAEKRKSHVKPKVLLFEMLESCKLQKISTSTIGSLWTISEQHLTRIFHVFHLTMYLRVLKSFVGFYSQDDSHHMSLYAKSCLWSLHAWLAKKKNPEKFRGPKRKHWSELGSCSLVKSQISFFFRIQRFP